MSARTVLIADDDPSILRLLQVNFRLEGFDVQSASNGREVLDLIEANGVVPDVIVLDVMMPGMDGWEVARRLKEDPGTQAIPIILLTARSQEADRRKGLALGVFDYVTKPFDPGHLMTVVGRAISAD